VRTLVKVFSVILPCGTIIESADLFRKTGFVFYPEQFFAAVFALAGALVYLAVPAGKGASGRAHPLVRYQRRCNKLRRWIYIAINYPRFSEFSTGFPISGVVVAFVVILLLLEGLRRTSGMESPSLPSGYHPGSGQPPFAWHDDGRQVNLDRLLYYLTWIRQRSWGCR